MRLKIYPGERKPAENQNYREQPVSELFFLRTSFEMRIVFILTESHQKNESQGCE